MYDESAAGSSRWARARRSHRLAFVVLTLTSIAIAVSGLVWQASVPTSLLIIPLVIGGVLLRFRELVALNRDRGDVRR